jgi:hypothetical protein
MKMNRRQLAGTLAGIAAASRAARGADGDRRSRFYVLERYHLQQGTQPGRMHEWFRNGLIPRLAKIHTGPLMILDAQIAPHTPEILTIAGISSLDEYATLRNKVTDDEAAMAAARKMDQGAEPPFDSQATIILEAAPYSPELVAEKRDTPRIFELRVYHSPRFSQLQALHNRFNNAEIKIFHRCGIHPVLYGTTIIGPNQPNLTYLIPFESLAAREKAWAAFAADPDWIKTRQESIDKYGQITAVNDISIYRAAAYSPIK